MWFTKMSLLSFSVLLSFQVVAAKSVSKAQAQITSSQNKEMKADIVFETTKDGVKVSGHAMGLEPNSKHGLHVHQNGECKAPDYKTAGDHFNPEGKKHGAPLAKESHLGDLGNLVANDKGEAHVELVLSQRKAEDLKKLVGKAVLIHKEADDLKTQPSGDSGARIACGIIKTI